VVIPIRTRCVHGGAGFMGFLGITPASKVSAAKPPTVRVRIPFKWPRAMPVGRPKPPCASTVLPGPFSAPTVGFSVGAWYQSWPAKKARFGPILCLSARRYCLCKTSPPLWSPIGRRYRFEKFPGVRCRISLSPTATASRHARPIGLNCRSVADRHAWAGRCRYPIRPASLRPRRHRRGSSKWRRRWLGLPLHPGRSRVNRCLAGNCPVCPGWCRWPLRRRRCPPGASWTRQP